MRKPIVDRSLRVSDVGARIESEQIRPQAIALIERAGLCSRDADEVLAGLAIALQRYRNDAEHPEQWPKAGEQRAELQHVARCATEFNEAAARLADALKALSLPSRKAILYEQLESASSVERLVDPRAHQALPLVTSPVESVSAAAARAAQKLPSGVGRRKDPARDLLFTIAIIWHSREPKRDRPGVTASGTRRRGPLVDFAIELLKLEDSGERGDSIGRLARASAKVGKLLYELQAEAKNPRSFYEQHRKRSRE